MHRGAVANVRRSGGKVSSIEVTAEEMKKKKKLCSNNFFYQCNEKPTFR